MTDQTDGQIRPFAAVLRDVQGGAALDRASDLLNHLTEAVATTGRKGTLTMVVTVEPYGKNGDTRNLDVTVRSTVKAPESGEGGHRGVFFHTGGNLVREDPGQQVLAVRMVPDPTERTGT